MTASTPYSGKAIEIHAGFIPLTDCAPLVVAKELGLDRANGLNLSLHREVSWANIRDKAEAGYLDCAIALAPMPLAATLGLGGRPPVAMLALMSTSLNGNAITVSRALFEEMLDVDAENCQAGGMTSARALAKAIAQRRSAGREPLTLGMVYPFSCHNYDLRYWLASAGADPETDVNIVVVPPPLIASSLKSGRIDGFCVGEPWSSVSVDQGDGVIIATKPELWDQSPEKVLMVRKAFADEQPGVAAALIRCLVQAGHWLHQTGNRQQAAEWLAQGDYVGVSSGILRGALLNNLARGDAALPQATGEMIVFGGPHANFPWHSHARWLLTQMVRWGQVRAPFDICDVAGAVYRPDLYRSAVKELAIEVPDHDVKPEGGGGFFGAEAFDPEKPATYIAQQLVRRTDIDPQLFSSRG